jgi:phage-related protein
MGSTVWLVNVLEGQAAEQVMDLPLDMRAKLLRIMEYIRSEGLARLHEPYVKHIQGKLWEIRLSGRSGIARSLYVTASGKRVVIVRTFIKKTEKTPRQEVELALKRAQGVL